MGDAMTAAIVQQMVPGGVELLVGAVVDPTFGPLVACGSGGVLVDSCTTRRSASTRSPTSTRRDDRQPQECRAPARVPRPGAVRRTAVVDALLACVGARRVCPEIQELELNPLKVLQAVPGPSTSVFGLVNVCRKRPPVIFGTDSQDKPADSCAPPSLWITLLRVGSVRGAVGIVKSTVVPCPGVLSTQTRLP